MLCTAYCDFYSISQLFYSVWIEKFWGLLYTFTNNFTEVWTVFMRICPFNYFERIFYCYCSTLQFQNLWKVCINIDVRNSEIASRCTGFLHKISSNFQTTISFLVYGKPYISIAGITNYTLDTLDSSKSADMETMRDNFSHQPYKADSKAHNRMNKRKTKYVTMK